MKHTHASMVIEQLRSSGFSVEKCYKESQWQVKDNTVVLFFSRSLGDLAKKAEKEFGL